MKYVQEEEYWIRGGRLRSTIFIFLKTKLINFFGLWTLFYKFHNNTTKHLYYHHDVNFFILLFYFILFWV
jgi:hypothetical protein